MGAIKTAADLAFRDYEISNVPASGAHAPVKSEIRDAFSLIDTTLVPFLSPAYNSSNIANAALAFSVPNRPIGQIPTYNGFVFSQGTPYPAIKQGGQDLNGLQQALVATCSIAAGDPRAGVALAAYAETNSPDPSNAIAIYALAQGNVAGCSVFGANIVAHNIADSLAHGLNANYLCGLEINVNKWKTALGLETTVNGDHFYGLNIQGGGNHTDELGSAIIINNSAVPAPTRWATGLEIARGAAAVGIKLGQSALGSNQGSQGLRLYSTNAGGTDLFAQIFSDANSSLYLLPSANSAVIIGDGLGNVLGEFQTVAGLGGNTGFQLPQVTAAGVLVTSATGVVSSTLTLPGGLTAPPSGAAGGDLGGTYPNPTLAAIISAGGPIGGATVAPIITYDAKGRLTGVSSATITPAVGSVTGLGTGIATFLATPSSANLRAALTDEVGSGAAYFVGGALGTPASGVATNLTGLPISTGLTGAGTGVLTALGVNVGTAGSVVINAGVLGTPASGVATNLTGLPISTGLTGAGTGVLTALGINVGTAGSVVVNGGALGTPSSGVGTNITNVNAATLNAATFAAPGAIGGGTPSTGAFTTVTASTSITPTNIVGTSTNNNASAGSVGEYVPSSIASGSQVALTTNTPTLITSISLTAGDWDVTLQPIFIGAATTLTNYIFASVSSAGVLDMTTPGAFASIGYPTGGTAIYASGTGISMTLSPFRFSLSGTTTISAYAQSGFTTSTAGVYGLLRARRIR